MWVGAHEIEAGRMTVGSFVSFTLYLGLLVGPVIQIVSIGSQITEAFAGLERIRELRDELAEDAGDREREPLPPLEGRVEFRDVSFEYEEDVPVLHDVSFVASPGTVTALVGPSGSGKSTIIGLVAAFYRPTEGTILVDGRDLSKRAPVRLPRPDRRRLPGQLPLRRHASSRTSLTRGRRRRARRSCGPPRSPAATSSS